MAADIRFHVVIGVLSLMAGSVPSASAQTEELLKGRSDREVCAAIKQWIERDPAITVWGRDRDVVPFLLPSEFVPAFGTPFDQLTKKDFEKLQKGLRRCERDNQLGAELYLARHLLDASRREAFITEAGRIAPDLRLFESAAAEIPRLEPTVEGLRRLDQIEESLRGPMQRVDQRWWPVNGATFEKARRRLFPAVMRSHVTSKVAAARTRQHALELVVMRGDIGPGPGFMLGLDWKKLTVTPELHAELHLMLTNGLRALGATLADEERKAAGSFGEGLSGLAASARIVEEFTTRNRPFFDLMPEVDRVRGELLDARAALLRQTQPVLMQAIEMASTHTEVEQLLSRHLTAEERERSDSAIVRAARQRSGMLRASADNARIFGSPVRGPSIDAIKARFLSSAEERRRYHSPEIIRSILHGDVTTLPPDRIYVRAYLVQQARMLGEVCGVFTVATLRELESIALRDVMPSTRDVQAAVVTTLESLAALAEGNAAPWADNVISGRPRSRARLDAAEDLNKLADSYGPCTRSYVPLYSKNLESFIRKAGRER